uniref:Uncharacterized protein n=1 Tax=Anopheles epiroticus TaxID=199890 RepID=A0A182PWS5_9DIPT
MSKSIGNIESYLMGENIESYLKRLDIFMDINEVVEEKKAKYMLSIGGASLYGVAEKRAGSSNKKHLKPQVNEVAKRFKCRLVYQKEMSMSEFIIELKAAPQSCEFGEFLQSALRDQLVAGVNDIDLRKKLLTESRLTFDQACNIAQTWDAARRQNEEMYTCRAENEIAASSIQHRECQGTSVNERSYA